MTTDLQALRALVSNWRASQTLHPSYILDDLCPQVVAVLDQLVEVAAARDKLADIAEEWIGFRAPSLDTFAEVALEDVDDLRRAGTP